MNATGPGLLDSDVFISAKNQYYAFDICPAFWNSLVQYGGIGDIRSIDKVRNELLAGRETEDLVQWVKNDMSPEFFHETTGQDVIDAYAEVMLWVQRSARYFDRAKAKFATEADGWLVAYSMVNDTTVVTNEQPRPESRNRILLPDVCEQFEVVYMDTFSMLRRLGVQFN